MQEFENHVAETSRDALRMMFQSPAAVHLYFVPGSVAGGGYLAPVREGEPIPRAAELAAAERLPSHLTEAQLTRWIRDRARRLPILPLRAAAATRAATKARKPRAKGPGAKAALKAALRRDR